MTDETQVFDAFDDATNAELPAQEYWGQVNIDAWNCALVKGAGKLPYDPSQHDKKFTAVDISMTPLAEMNLQWAPERNLIAQFGAWVKITWRSAQALGIGHARDLNLKYARAKLSPTGRTWEKDGEKKEETTFEFLAFFDTEEECRADYFATTGKSADDVAPTQQPVAQPAPAAVSPRDNALKFAKKIIENAYAKSPDDVMSFITEQFAKFPLVGNHISVDDAEVQEMIMNEEMK